MPSGLVVDLAPAHGVNKTGVDGITEKLSHGVRALLIAQIGY